MPKTKLQGFVFTLIMAFLMVYAMIAYNIALDQGGMTNEIFLLVFHELIIMYPIAILLEMLICEKASEKLTFRLLTPKDKPIFILLTRCTMIVLLMCPMMSFVATLLFKHPGTELIAKWLETTIVNFPMALCWQLFAAGPIGRRIFGFLLSLTATNKLGDSVPEN